VHDITEIDLNFKVLSAAGLLALLAVLLIGFPAELVNKTLEENQLKIRRWFAWGSLGKVPLRERILMLPPAGVFIVVSLAAAFLYGFLDPDFGWDKPSLALLVGLFISIVVATLAFEVPNGIYAHSRGHAQIRLRALPAALIMAIPCVIVSRGLDFSPGYMYGIVAGFVILSGELDRRQSGRAVLFSSMSLLIVALSAWVIWTPVNQSIKDQADPSIGLLVMDAALAAVFVAGLEALAFGLVPMRFLNGSKIWKLNRVLWAVVYASVIFIFSVILLRPESGYISTSDRVSWFFVIALFLGFGLFSVLLWAFFRFQPAEVSDEEAGLAEDYELDLREFDDVDSEDEFVGE